MTRPRLYLHVGPPKTGTSAVQHALRKHDDSVVVYPKVGLWPDGAHHNLVFNFYEKFTRPDIVRLDVAAAVAEIGESARRSGKSVVISSESLFGVDVKPLLDALLAAIGAGLDEAEIVVVWREPYTRASSSYNQRVKDPHIQEKRSPDAYLREMAPAMAYAPRLERLAAVGAPLRIMAYEPRRDFPARFLSHIGFPAQLMPAFEPRNVSLAAKGLVAMLAANRISLAQGPRVALLDALARQRKLVSPSRFLFDPEVAREVEPLFRRDREKLAARWGFETPPLDLDGAGAALTLSPEEAKMIDLACEALNAEERAAMRAEVAGFVTPSPERHASAQL